MGIGPRDNHGGASKRLADGSGRVPIAMITNSLPPYRLHVHLRVAREMPELLIHTLRTHVEDDRWLAIDKEDAAEIGLVSLDAGVSVWEQGLRRNWLHEWRVGGRLIDWIRRHGIQAVVLVGYNDPARARLLLWCRWHRIPVLVWGDSNIRDDDANLRGRPVRTVVKRLIVSALLRLSAGALSFGTAGQAYFQKYGVPAKRIFRFPMEPDYQAIRSLALQAMAAARARFGLSEERHRFLFCGRMVPEKRPDLLIEAFCSIAALRPSWDLVMLGDGQMRGKLEQSVPSLLRERIIWTGHQPDQVTVQSIQRCCDVLVLPSDREPWALVVNEALAAGMAVVSSSIAGAAVDLVRDGINGRLFRPGNPAALQDCLLDVSDDHRLAAMKARSRTVLEEWIRTADPVCGLRRALASVRVARQGQA